MAQVLITLKIMPESTESSLDAIEEKAKQEISAFGAEFIKAEKEPIAFGLMALKIIISMDEAKGSPDPLEEKIKAIEGVMSAEVTDVRRAFG